MFRADTIAAVATPPGEGGIAVIRVSGPKALEAAAQIFRPARGGDTRDFPGYSVHYGTFVESASDDRVDDGLLTVFRAPRSYTGEEMAELSCHGGRAVVARVLQLTLNAGARLAEPGEFTQRAFLNGKLDLAQAEAVSDLIRAKTEAARRLARRQLDGELSQEVTRIKDELIGILAAVEVTIDFSDEVGELDYAAIKERIGTVLAYIQRLLMTAERGRMLREGVKVAIVGRPNVGKSSLLNALLRAERAIVTDVPGTTRDVIEEQAHLDGIPLVLTDTAGLRDAEDVAERIGVARARGVIAQSDVILFVIDAVEGFTAADAALLSEVTTGSDHLCILPILNKCDAVTPEVLAAIKPQTAELAFVPASSVALSALTGEGIPMLEERLRQLVEAEGTDSVIVANARHRQAFQQAWDSLAEALVTVQERLPGDFIAIDVRGALDALGLITGETVTDDIIHRIFQDFCVGK